MTTLADDGAGSLRAAIEATNLVAGADVIVIDSNLEGIIELASSLPGVTESLTILGPGADRVAVDANETWRVLDFSAAPADGSVEFTPGVDDTLLFFDGFESGDTTQWSSASS